MNDTQYNLMADELLLALEEAIEDCGVDIDYEGVGGMLTLTFKNASKIIINKQAPLREIWVATKFNGHHFHFENDQWRDKRSGDEFWQFISESVSVQAQSQVSLCV